MNSTIVAEIGSCHDGKLDTALTLIEEAAACGATFAKFQYWSSAERLSQRRNQKKTVEAYKKYAVPRAWLEPLKKQTEKAGIGFACTTYLPEDIEIVAPLVDWFKVASFEAKDCNFIESHVCHQKPIWVSTGMLTQNEVDLLLDTSGWIRLLHCTSAYPCPPEDANLLALRDHHDGRPFGFSDHTTEVITGALAVTLGAALVEKHVRSLGTNTLNPDFPHALTPTLFMNYCSAIRSTEILLGDGKKRIMPSEGKSLAYQVRP